MLRRSVLSQEARAALKAMHAAHRSAYMGERKAYYVRRNLARDNPTKCWSFIIDGMQQVDYFNFIIAVLKMHFL